MNVAVLEAHFKLSALLDKVCDKVGRGDKVVVTRHGAPIARPVPMNAQPHRTVPPRAGGAGI